MESEIIPSVGLSRGITLGGSLGRERRKHHHVKTMSEPSDDELEESSVHLLNRVKSDRIAITKPEEDRRRRTIIVEKKNGSYGFTLQSYGIHYKKEGEIEMLTYVDYVEYEGPAFKAGMRQGDVILSINGTDMEKADHKTLVAFIKNCDTRMRMVVLFEDCVRKVELHMRYIQLQNTLQDKMNDLESICLRERQLLEGKWKTHSLPARKKIVTTPAEFENLNTPTNNEMQNSFYRSTLSNENICNIGKPKQTIIPPPAQFMLTYQYLDPNYRYILKPSTTSSSGEYFIGVSQPSKTTNDQHYILTRASSIENTKCLPSFQHQMPIQQLQQQQQLKNDKLQSNKLENKSRNSEKQKPIKTNRYCHGHSCNPCLGHFSKKTDKNGDNTSLDAYDLASPCCETHCVPTRRRSRHNKEHHHKHKHRDKYSKDPQRPRSSSYVTSNANQTLYHHHHHHHHNHQKNNQPNQYQPQNLVNISTDNKSNLSHYFDITTGLASHCSLHSCTSSEFAPADSSTSYTTSISTDTLYWEPQNEAPSSRQHSTKSRQSLIQKQNAQTQQLAHPLQQERTHQHRYHLHAAQIQPVCQIYQSQPVQKPKSWDNLTTKAFGGYGYGYLDTVGAKPPIKMQLTHQRHSMPRKNPYGRYSTFTDIENYAPPPTQFLEETTTTTVLTKSTENLIKSYEAPKAESNKGDYVEKKASISAPGSHFIPNHGQNTENISKTEYYSNLSNNHNNDMTDTRNTGVATISQATRL